MARKPATHADAPAIGEAGCLRQSPTVAASATGRRPSSFDAPRKTFDWLEGATGVQLAVSDGDGRRTIRLGGEIDQASIDVIESAVREAFVRRPGPIELDLRDVSFIERAGNEMIERCVASAREHRISLVVTRRQATAARRPGEAAACPCDRLVATSRPAAEPCALPPPSAGGVRQPTVARETTADRWPS